MNALLISFHISQRFWQVGRVGTSGVLLIQLKQSQVPNFSEFKGEEMGVVPRLAELCRVICGDQLISEPFLCNGQPNSEIRWF